MRKHQSLIIFHTSLGQNGTIQIPGHRQWWPTLLFFNFVQFTNFSFILKKTSILEMITYIPVTNLTIKILILWIVTNLMTGKNALLIHA